MTTAAVLMKITRMKKIIRSDYELYWDKKG